MSTVRAADIEIKARSIVVESAAKWRFHDRTKYDDVQTLTITDERRFKNMFETAAGSLDGLLSRHLLMNTVLPKLGLQRVPNDLLDDALQTFSSTGVSTRPKSSLHRARDSGADDEGELEEKEQIEGKEADDKEGKHDDPETPDDVDDTDDGAESKTSEEVVYSWEDFQRILEKVYAPSYIYGKLLNRACARGDEAVIKELLFRGCNPNDVDGRGMTCIHYAAEKGRDASIQALRQHWNGNVKMDEHDHSGWTPFITAASRGFVSTMQLLKSLGAGASASTKVGRTALHWAALKGHTDVVQFLAKDKPLLNQQDNLGWTALHCAVINADANIIMLLIDGGIDKQIEDKCQRTARDYCTPDLLEMFDAATTKRNKSRR